jgi:crotonobetainyl-CoA:carnitine CoA-transferase CaiB-like acyl-CoA transferase
VFHKINPRLIYASASGYGKDGPYRNNLALDLTIQAVGGLMSATGERGGRPLKAGVPVADFMSGAHLYGAVVTALFERERTGRGRVLEVSMLESIFATLLPSAGHAYASDAVPQRSGNRHVADSYVPFDTFETSDGWIAIVCGKDEHWIKLTKAMQRPDLENDLELRELKGRIDRIDEITDIVAAWAKKFTRDDLWALCQEYSVPSSPLRDVVEVLNDPHLHERGFLSEHVAATGPVYLPNSPMRYEGSPLMELVPAPELGGDTDAVLGEILGLGKDELAKLRSEGAFG